MKKLRKLLRLNRGERWTLAQAMILLPLTALALRLIGLRRSQRIFSHFIPRDSDCKTEGSEASLNQALHISHLVNLAVRHGVFPANCLQRSLALWWLLRRRRIQGEIKVGTRKVSGRFEAHAWIEVDGVVLNDSDDVRLRYAPFDRAVNLIRAGRQ